MTEQPSTEPANTQPDEPSPAHDADHGHVRTEGETSVDDAIGTSDDPR